MRYEMKITRFLGRANCFYTFSKLNRSHLAYFHVKKLQIITKKSNFVRISIVSDLFELRNWRKNG